MIPSSPSHKGLLTRLTLLWHLAIVLLLLLTSQLPSFDSSAAFILRLRWLTPLLRWDVFHYLHIADNGYVYEYEFAFFPGVPVLMRTCKGFMHLFGSYAHSNVIVELLTGAITSFAISVDTIRTLYDLSLVHLRSTNVALLVSLLSLMSSSPATLRFAPYAEPFFTYLSYKGMLFCARCQFTRASIAFGLASFFKSNGAMLSGYILWGLLVEEVLKDAPSEPLDFRKLGRKALSSLPLLSLPILPFIWHQYVGYVQFCDVAPQESRPWCTHRIPLIYSFVQSEYWNVGPFRYWTLQQAPNILLGSPALALLMYGSIWHIRYSLFPCLRRLWRQDRLPKKSDASNETSLDPFLDPSITPHAIHALILSVTLLISAHTQIVLRFASALPFTYWAAARLFFPAPCPDDISFDESRKASQTPTRAARWWVGWSMAWGAISIVAWGVFLPPA